jgi:hypothetical protein
MSVCVIERERERERERGRIGDLTISCRRSNKRWRSREGE